MSKKTIFSGIQPSGQPGLGNLMGAITPQIAMQNEGKAIYFIADLHAITVRQEPQALQDSTYEVAAWYLAAGLDVNKATLFVQSHVRAHAELSWILSTFTPMGDLERMTQFKEKSQKHKKNINAGLFTYPVLQAADILLYNSNVVPVGEDQVEHIELARDIATRFNGIYGDILTVPEFTLPKLGARIKNLQDPTKKMSKSDDGQGVIFLLDDMALVEKKIKKAETDSLGKVNFDVAKQPGISNLLTIYAAASGVSIDEAVKQFADSQYGNFKQAVADSLVAHLEPIQQRFKELVQDKSELTKILAQGAKQASATAEETLAKVKQAVGFVPS